MTPAEMTQWIKSDEGKAAFFELLNGWTATRDGRIAIAKAVLTESFFQPKIAGKTTPVNDVLSALANDPGVDVAGLATELAPLLGTLIDKTVRAIFADAATPG